MIPPQFVYFAPTTLPEALTLLRQYGSEAKLLSGGQSLIPLMKLRLATPAYLIDINRISGLDYLHERDGVLRIGALTREADLEHSGRVEGRRACCRWRVSSSALSIAEWVHNSTVATFPAPATSNAACGFPALRFPARFMPRVMGLILLGALSAVVGAPGSC
jgi:hypothetical protein